VGRDPIALQGKFAKENLSVEVSFVSIDAGHDGMEEALEEVLAQTKEGEKTLIFCSSQGDWTRGGAGWAIWYGVEGTERKVKKILEGLGRPTDQVCFYHGGLTAEVKAEAADDFIRGDKTIMVATCAFGTGVDVDDIRNVIHLGAPSGLEAWYQESGRAGRDGKPAKAYVLIDLEEDIGEAIAQAGIRSSEDGLNVLREELSAITWRGSIMRQMNLLLGDVDPTPFAKEFDPLKSFPSRPPKGKPIRLGSFPGWRFENEVYSRWIVGELEGAKKGSKLVFFHRDHDALIWKAVHRLDMLGLIKGYERTYKMNGNNSFALRVNNLQTAARREALVEKVVAFSERALGGAFAEQLKDRLLVKSAEGQWYFSDDINSANSKERILAASKALAFTTYETVRRIRMNSFFSLMTFFNLTTDIERREYINGYISRDPADDEFRELVEKDSVEVSDYQAALTESKVWAKDRPQHLKGVLRGVLQGDMQGGSIANFLLLHAVLSHDGRTKYSEARVLASNLLRDTTLPSELICWALDELGLANGEIMPELLEEILREAESNESQPDNIRFARDWAMSRKEEFGQTSLAHYQMSYWLRGN